MSAQASALPSGSLERTRPAPAPPEPSAAVLHGASASAPLPGHAHSPSMHLQTLLNEPRPAVPPTSIYQANDHLSPPPHRQLPSSSAPRSSLPSTFSPPQPDQRFFPPAPPRAVADVLFSSSVQEIQAALRQQSNTFKSFPNADNASAESGAAVTTAFNTYDPTERNKLWSDWLIFSTLCRSLAVPVFPVEPDKVALVLAAYADLPCSDILRELAQFGGMHFPEKVPRIIAACSVAAKATRQSWPDVRCFIRGPDDYEATRALVDAVCGTNLVAPSSTGFLQPAPPPPPKPKAPSPTIPRDLASRPKLAAAPPARSAPKLKVQRPLPKVDPLRFPEGTLRALARDFSEALEELRSEPSDPLVFDIAGSRFAETANSPAFASRVASLHNTAIIYTHITALLAFPTYPITTLKLGVFALAMTPGSFGKAVDVEEPSVVRERECPRATPKQLEILLKDVTALRMITRGGDEAIADGEKQEWMEWWEEVRDDINPKPPGKKRPSQPAKKRAKRSDSPDSERGTGSGRGRGGARKPRSRLHPTDPSSSRSSSRAGTPSSINGGGGARIKSSAGYGYAYAFAELRPDVVYPHWTPPVKGALPSQRKEPPVPPVLDCPWWVPRKKKAKPLLPPSSSEGGEGEGEKKATQQEGPAILGQEVASKQSLEEEEEEQEAKERVQGRSIALHRPKRGGLDMYPFDVSRLWDAW
ncbi:hypothetical protein JCM8547_000212 [Rhodosporidiobolus lusitaniae]